MSAVVGQALETDLALPITWAPKIRRVGQAAEVDEAWPVGRLKTRVLGQAVETDLAQPITPRKARVVGLVEETDVAHPIGQPNTLVVGQVVEIDQAQPLGRAKRKLILTAPTPDYASLILSHGPLAYWRLGESSGTVAADTSGNGRTGTYTNGPTLGQAGAISGDADTAVSFDGVDDRVTAAAFTFPAAFSVEMWIRPTSVVSRVCFATEQAGPVGLRLFISVDQQLYAMVDGGAIGGGASLVITGNVWTHVVWTNDGSTSRLYLNGVLQHTAAQTHASESRPVVIGDSDITGATDYEGRIDEVAIYGAALSDAQVLGHYQAGTAGATPTEMAQPITRVRSRVLGQVTELDTALPIAAPGVIVVPVGQAVEVDAAQPIAWAPKHRLVGLATEVDTAQSFTPPIVPAQVAVRQWRRRQLWHRSQD